MNISFPVEMGDDHGQVSTAGFGAQEHEVAGNPNFQTILGIHYQW